MSNSNSNPLLKQAIAAASVLAAGAATQVLAAPPANVDTSAWECTQCPYPDDGQVASQVEVGLGNVSDASAKFGEYTGLDSNGIYPVVSGAWRQSLPSGLACTLEMRANGPPRHSVPMPPAKLGTEALPREAAQIVRTLDGRPFAKSTSALSPTCALPVARSSAGAPE